MNRQGSRSAGGRNDIDKLAGAAGAAIGASGEEVKNAAQSGDLGKVLSKLTPQQAQQLKKVLSDEDAAKKLLATPQAQELIKRFSKK